MNLFKYKQSLNAGILLRVILIVLLLHLFLSCCKKEGKTRGLNEALTKFKWNIYKRVPLLKGLKNKSENYRPC